MPSPRSRLARTAGGALLTAGLAFSSACGDVRGAVTADAALDVNVVEASLDAEAAPSSPEAVDGDARVSSSACASPDDCIDFVVGPAVSCCINRTCIYGQSAIDAVSCTDADVQLIAASNYDQSCKADSDCIPVGEGNFCLPGAGNCPSNAAINKSAYPVYQADVAKTNAGICRAGSSCGFAGGPCCLGGKCRMGSACPNPIAVQDAAFEGDARADASAE